MKKVDMMTQLINTGAKQKVSGKTKGSSSSDSSDFEKMLEQAGEQQGFTAGDTSGSTSGTSGTPTSAGTVTDGKSEEPGVVEMSIAAALVTTQPVMQVEPIEQVEVADIAPAGVEAVTANPVAENTAVQQVVAGPVAAGQMDDQQAMTEAVPQDLVTASDTAVQQQTQTVTMEGNSDAGQQVEVGTKAREDAPAAEVTEKTEEDPVVEDASAAVDSAPVFDEAKAVPVKVADSGEPVNPQEEDAAAQLGRQIEQAIAQGETTVEVTLTPASLGQLTVAISRLGDGDLAIVLTTVTGKAAQLLDRHVGNLQNMLADSQNVHVEIETRTQETQAQQFLNPDGQNNHHHDQQQHHHQEKDEKRDDGDFLQQLRLGLVGLD